MALVIMNAGELRDRWLRVLPSLLPELPLFEAVDAVAQRRSSIRPADARQIDSDVHRSEVSQWYPELEILDEAHRRQLQQSLRRLLRAWCLLHPEIGYSQAMNFIAMTLLRAVCDEDLPSAFALFCGLIARLPEGFYSDSPPLVGYQVEVEALLLVLERRFPDLFEGAAGERMREAIALASAKWFLNQWIGSLPLHALLALWDQHFCADMGDELRPATSIRVVLTLFSLHPPDPKANGGAALYGELLHLGEDCVEAYGTEALLLGCTEQSLEPWPDADDLRAEARARLGLAEVSMPAPSHYDSDNRLRLAELTSLRALLGAHVDVTQSTGYVTQDLLEFVLGEVKPDWGSEVAARLASALDVERTGRLKLREVVTAFAAVLNGSLFERLCIIFSLYDPSGSGTLDADSLCEMTLTLIKLSEAAADFDPTSPQHGHHPLSEPKDRRARSLHSSRAAAASFSWGRDSHPRAARYGRDAESALAPKRMLKRGNSDQSCGDLAASLNRGYKHRAVQLQQRLLWMDQDDDGCLTMEEWCHGAFANASMLRCLYEPILPVSGPVTPCRSILWRRLKRSSDLETQIPAVTFCNCLPYLCETCCGGALLSLLRLRNSLRGALRIRFTIRRIPLDTEPMARTTATLLHQRKGATLERTDSQLLRDREDFSGRDADTSPTISDELDDK